MLHFSTVPLSRHPQSQAKDFVAELVLPELPLDEHELQGVRDGQLEMTGDSVDLSEAFLSDENAGLLEVGGEHCLGGADGPEVELAEQLGVPVLYREDDVGCAMEGTGHGEAEGAVEGEHVHDAVLPHVLVEGCEVVDAILSLEVIKAAIECLVLEQVMAVEKSHLHCFSSRLQSSEKQGEYFRFVSQMSEFLFES